MFDIGFSELLLIMVIGLVVLGPERLPVAVRTVAGWIKALRSLASSVQHELAHELKLQELQESLKKVEKAGMENLTPELKASMDELKEAAESLKRGYHDNNEQTAPTNTIHSPLVEAKSEPEAEHDIPEHVEHNRPRAAESNNPLAPPTATLVADPVIQTQEGTTSSKTHGDA